MSIPKQSKYVIIGAGIHGLSTAWKLAEKLKSGKDIIVIDKSGIASGASGIACGVVRNNYFQPAMRELMAHSVSVWESDPKAFHYHPIGYMQISPESMRENVTTIYEQQKELGYESEFIEGRNDSMKYMKNIFHDWQAKGITSVLHEKRGGYANATPSMYGLADKAESLGVKIITNTKVTGFKKDNSNTVIGVVTSEGTIECEQVIVGVGPWVRDIWNMLELPNKITIKTEKGQTHKDYPMWIYWFLQEGVLGVDPNLLKKDDGKLPPVIHVDSDAHLFSDVDGSLITDKMWGIYYKPDFNFKGVQGGTAPYKVNKPADKVNVDPYGVDSQEYLTGDEFAHMWTSALAHCQKRFEGQIKVYQNEPSGGLGCFTPDSFPIFDRFCENVNVIADSNHGYKMIGVGELVADEILGNENGLLKPFRFNRYEKGELHPTSNSPFPWS